MFKYKIKEEEENFFYLVLINFYLIEKECVAGIAVILHSLVFLLHLSQMKDNQLGLLYWDFRLVFVWLHTN